MIEIWTIHEVVTKNSQTGGLGGKEGHEKRKNRKYIYIALPHYQIRQWEMAIFEINYTYSSNKDELCRGAPNPL